MEVLKREAKLRKKDETKEGNKGLRKSLRKKNKEVNGKYPPMRSHLDEARAPGALFAGGSQTQTGGGA